MQQLRNLTERAKDARKCLEDEFWHLLLVLLVASGIAGLSLFADTTQDSLSEWLRRMALAMPVAFLTWAMGYVPMLNSERRKREAAEKALAEERERAYTERREFFQRVEKLLEQVVVNTTPSQPNQPDQSASESEHC